MVASPAAGDVETCGDQWSTAPSSDVSPRMCWALDSDIENVMGLESAGVDLDISRAGVPIEDLGHAIIGIGNEPVK